MQKLAGLGRFVAIVCLLLLMLVFVLFWEGAFAEWMPETDRVITWLSVLLLAAMALYGARRVARHFAEVRRRQARQSADSALVGEIPDSQTILYLRPFKVDSKLIEPVSYDGETFSSVEALLCTVLARNGIPIAIGRPLEKHQPLGAMRMYAKDDQWKDVVSHYLSESKLVVLYVDFTPGVKWEIGRSIRSDLDKLIIIPKYFNLKAGLLHPLFIAMPFAILYPFYHLFTRSFLLKRVRRGRSYYRHWQQAFDGIIDQHVDDRVAAVTFLDGVARHYPSADARLESQLDAVIAAMKDKIREG